MRARARLVGAAVLALAARGLAAGSDPGALDSYVQELRVTPGPGAGALTVRMAPLLHAARWAVTQRWDDNLVDALTVRDLDRAAGVHATFYLNASDAWYINESHRPGPADPPAALGKALLEGGNSVGGHTLTHSYVPDLNRQEDFRELLQCRIDREVNTQSPVDSFVFPFLETTNAFEHGAVHADLARLLLRAGYLHVANDAFNGPPFRHTGLVDSPLLPCDGLGDPLGDLRARLARPAGLSQAPAACLCMHAWPAAWGGTDFPRLKAFLQATAGHRDWWYPNGNAWSAYRYQFLHGTLKSRRDGAATVLSLGRFEPWDLGWSEPCTLVIQGAGPTAPDVRLQGLPLAVWHNADRTLWYVDVPDSPGHGLPEGYGWYRNPEPDPAPKPGIWSRLRGVDARLSVEGTRLRLRVANAGAALEQLRVRPRLPLGYQEPAAVRPAPLVRGGTLDLSWPLRPQGPELERQGTFYAAVQVDGVRGGKRLRFYADVRKALEPRDETYPKGAFLVLGPLPGDRPGFDVDAFADTVLAQSPLKPCDTAFPGYTPCWEPSPERLQDPLHPEIIPAGATEAPRTFYTWDPGLVFPYGHRLHYLLWGTIVSPERRTVTAQLPDRGVDRVVLNGRTVTGTNWSLAAGVNTLGIEYGAHSPTGQKESAFSPYNYGPFLRLCDGQGHRLTDLRYELPALAGTPPAPGLKEPAAAAAPAMPGEEHP